MAAFTAIDDPSAYFKVQLYTGNGSANNAITFDDTDTDMQPDLVWIKNRDATDSHCLFDSVRGATKLLVVDTNAAEVTDTDTLDSFTSDGFQVDADVKVNTNTEKYVAWCWKAGTTSGITTDGNTTITPSSYSFNQTSGFSVLVYTGNTTSAAQVAHGLGATPEVFVVKRRTSTAGFLNYRKVMGGGGYSQWNVTTQPTGGSNTWAWNDTDPNSVNIVLGSSVDVNTTDSAGMVAWCFVPKQGFSKFGKYEGNGNADGTFVYTGFRPAFVQTMSIDSTSSWQMFDNKREGYNVDNDALVSEATTAEVTTDYIDLLSNGFKFRTTGDPNVAETYMYMAFAEAPFVNSNGVPCNAR